MTRTSASSCRCSSKKMAFLASKSGVVSALRLTQSCWRNLYDGGWGGRGGGGCEGTSRCRRKSALSLIAKSSKLCIGGDADGTGCIHVLARILNAFGPAHNKQINSSHNFNQIRYCLLNAEALEHMFANVCTTVTVGPGRVLG